MTDENLILGDMIAEQAAHLDAAQHRLLTTIRQFDTGEGWVSAKSCAHWLSWRVSWTLGTAREHVRVARALAKLPAIDEALSRGEVSYCQTRAMTRVATPANEQVLLMDAKLTTGAQLERICRKYRQLRRLAGNANPNNEEVHRYVRRCELDNGMVKIEAVLFPDEAAHVWACIDQVTKELAAAATEPSARSAMDPSPASGTVTVTSTGSDVSAESCDLSCESTIIASTESNVPAETCVPSDELTIIASTESNVPAETGVPRNESFVTTTTGSDVSAETCGLSCESPHASHPQFDQASFDDHSHYADPAADEHAVRLDEGASRFLEAEPCDGRGCTHTVCILRGGAVDWNAVEARLDGRLHDALPAAAYTAREPDFDTDKPSPTTSNRAAAAAKPGLAAGKRSTTRFNRADGLVALARRYAMGTSSKTPIEIVVTVPATVLQDGVLPDDQRVAVLADGTAIDGNTARRLSCDAGIVNLVEDGNGTPLTVGRRSRSIPTAISRALMRRDATCRFPGCTDTLFLHGHHIEHWADGGATSLSNLVRLCTRHHRYLHEYGYRIAIDGAGELTFVDPKGRPARDVPPRIQRDDLGWQHIVHANRDLDIEPRVPGWDGSPISYNDACHVLYLLDEGRTTTERVCGRRADANDSTDPADATDVCWDARVYG